MPVGFCSSDVRFGHFSLRPRPLWSGAVLKCMYIVHTVDCEWLAMSESALADESNGAPSRTRTCDLQLRRLSLYPVELSGLISIIHHT